MHQFHRSLVAGLAVSLIVVTAADATGLTVEGSIPLPDVAGRIDHMAFDPQTSRLFVAEHDNGTLDVVNLATGEVVGRITGLAGPQGVAFVPQTGQVVVANGGDGSVRFYDAATLSPGAKVALGGDADNVRIAPKSNSIVVGYGDGGLAVIDPASAKVISRFQLGAHPESFQISADGATAYVNLAESGQIAAVDLNGGGTSAFPIPGLGGNFPMALEEETSRLAVAFRSPTMLALVDPAARTVAASIETCADADDIFFDAKRSLLYVTCGAGVVEVVQRAGDRLTSLGTVTTGNGARTGLFVPQLDRLFVAAPARNGKEAVILVLRPDA